MGTWLVVLLSELACGGLVATDVLQLPTFARAEAKAEPANVSERVFLAKLRRKDPAVFEVFVRQHQDRVYEFCVRMVSDREEAFDLTQDIFFSIHQHLETFRADAKVTTWLFRIAKNHCLNRLKYLKRRGRGRSDDFGESNELAITESMGGSARPDDDLSRKNEVSLVHRAIETLDDEQRALVILRDVEGLSYHEIVEITDLAEGTVKSRLHRAREKLAKVLAQFETAPDAQNEGD